jgi:hypothetical protein
MKNKHYAQLARTKLLLFLAIFTFSFFGGTHHAKAGVWGESMAASALKQVQEELALSLHGAITGALKQAFAKVMNTQISVMIGGGNGKGAMFITNWQTFLVNDPQKQAHLYMNDFFSRTTQGRGSSSNYRPAPVEGCESNGFRGTVMQGSCVINSGDTSTKISILTNEQKSWFAQEGIVSTAHASTPALVNANINSVNVYDANYYKYQGDIAKKAITPSTPDIDLMNYVNGPSDIFTRGSWRGFNAFFANPANNPFGYSLLAQEAYQSKYDQERHSADIQAIAYQGFKASIGKDGISVGTPGITISQLVAKAQSFNFEVMSGAQDYGQIISSGITSAITMAINTAVTTGLNAATGAISDATGGWVNIDGSSLANVDWSGSGSGQSAEFNNGMNNFNSDAQSGITGNNQVWGDMNFQSTNVGSANASSQNSYSPLDSVNFQSPQVTPNTNTNTNTTPFIPDTDWSAPKTPQSSNPVWGPDNCDNLGSGPDSCEANGIFGAKSLF